MCHTLGVAAITCFVRLLFFMGAKREHFNHNIPHCAIYNRGEHCYDSSLGCFRKGGYALLVFHDERLVLLSVPKTGTTAYQAALRDRADIVVADPPELKHATVIRYSRWFRPMFERVCGTEMELMAVVREPISWLGSWYRFRQRPFMDGKPNSTKGISFDNFVSSYCTGKPAAFADVGSQAKFLEPRTNGSAVTHLFRYEDQPAIQDFLEDRLGMKLELEILNASPPMELTLTPRTERILRRKHAADFDLHASIGHQAEMPLLRSAGGRG
ncbi:gamma-glutamyl kinase [Phaeobacter sp. QD34_24]